MSLPEGYLSERDAAEYIGLTGSGHKLSYLKLYGNPQIYERSSGTYRCYKPEDLDDLMLRMAQEQFHITDDQ